MGNFESALTNVEYEYVRDHVNPYNALVLMRKMDPRLLHEIRTRVEFREPAMRNLHAALHQLSWYEVFNMMLDEQDELSKCVAGSFFWEYFKFHGAQAHPRTPGIAYASLELVVSEERLYSLGIAGLVEENPETTCLESCIDATGHVTYEMMVTQMPSLAFERAPKMTLQRARDAPACWLLEWLQAAHKYEVLQSQFFQGKDGDMAIRRRITRFLVGDLRALGDFMRACQQTLFVRREATEKLELLFTD